MKQYHYIQGIQRITRSMLVLLAMALATACSPQDDAFELPPAPAEKNVTFEVSIPRVNTPSTYGMTAVQEGRVTEATILAYTSVNGTEQLVRKIPVATADITSSSKTARFKVVMPAGKYHRLVLIANANAQANTLPLNSSLEALSSLQYTHPTGQWDVTTPDYIPMSGELVAESLNGFEIKKDIAKVFSNLKLIRMLARIDVGSAVRGVILKEISLYNMNCNGLIVNNANYSATPAQPNLPGTLENAISPITHSLSSPTFIREMYVLEAAAPTAATLGTTSPRIIIKVSPDALIKDYYYPVDFTYAGDQTGTTKGSFMPIVRNHQYIFTINKLTKRGFNTAAEALACTDVFTNNMIDVKLLVIDDDFTDVYYNEQNFLAVDVPNRNIVMGKAAYNAKMNDNTITVLTDAETFTIECYNKDGSLASATKMKPNQTSYAGGTKTDAYLIANYLNTGMDATEFEGYIIVKAGVKNLQSEEIPVYKAWCGIADVPMVNTIGSNVYKTHRYPTGVSDAMECWMVENSMEGTGMSKGYGLDWAGAAIGIIPSYASPEARGQVNGCYYTWEQRNNACPTGWSVPTPDQWLALHRELRLKPSRWWGGPLAEANNVFAGRALKNNTNNVIGWNGWMGSDLEGSYWWESLRRKYNYTTRGSNSFTQSNELTTLDYQYWLSVRCVKN
ncbi:MAG: FISUMP domain-containing protein [Bacteroides xylanisolvens]